MKEALAKEQDAETTERGVLAYGIARAAEMLSGRYHLVTTNVPYLKRGNHSSQLRNYLDKKYPESKDALETAFFERCLSMSEEGGSIGIVSQQYWLFLKSYRSLRKSILNSKTWNLLFRLGPNAFESVSGEVVKGNMQT